MPEHNAEPGEDDRADLPAQAPVVLDPPRGAHWSWAQYLALNGLERRARAALPERLLLPEPDGEGSAETLLVRETKRNHWYVAYVTYEGYHLKVSFETGMILVDDWRAADPTRQPNVEVLGDRVRATYGDAWGQHWAEPLTGAVRLLRISLKDRRYGHETAERLRQRFSLAAARTLPDPTERQTGLALADGWAGTPSELVATVRGLLHGPAGASPAP